MLYRLSYLPISFTDKAYATSKLRHRQRREGTKRAYEANFVPLLFGEHCRGKMVAGLGVEPKCFLGYEPSEPPLLHSCARELSLKATEGVEPSSSGLQDRRSFVSS